MTTRDRTGPLDNERAVTTDRATRDEERVLRERAVGPGRIGPGARPPAQSPRRPTVAFYTTGDTRTLTFEGVQPPAAVANLTLSDLYRTLATRAAPGRAHGVRTVRDATAVLARLPADRVSRVVFVGHGTNEEGGGFFLSGRPDDGVWGFEADTEQVFEAPRDATDHNAALVAQLLRVLVRGTRATVAFAACFTGAGDRLVPTLEGQLAASGRVDFVVQGYRDYLEVRIGHDGRRITGWRNRVVRRADLAVLGDATGPYNEFVLPPFQVEAPDTTLDALDFESDDPLGGIESEAGGPP